MKLRRILSLLLVLVMILSALVACRREPEDTDGTKSEMESINEVSNSKLLIANLSKYSIIVPQTGISDELAEVMSEFKALLEELGNTELGYREDLIIEGTEYAEGQYEILVGDTARQESKEVFAEIKKYNDYEIRMVGDKLVMVGMNDDSLAEGVLALTEKIAELPEGADYFFDESMNESFIGTYEVEELFIGETNILDYTIVYGKETAAIKLANIIFEKIRDKTGYKVDVLADTSVPAEGKKILIGTTKFGTPPRMENEAGYYVGSHASTLYIYADTTNSVVNLCKAGEDFAELLDTASGEKATINAELGCVVEEDTSMTSMSFNVYVGNSNYNGVINMIKKYMPDTVGVQEASDTWMNKLKDGLTDYAYEGVGRESNQKGEHCAIFYKKDKFTLKDSGTKWLSNTPDTPGSKLNGSRYVRIFTYALLERNSDGKQFMHINTHLDNEASKEVQRQQAQVITNFIRSYNKDVPIIMTGDFNCNIKEAAGKHLTSTFMEDPSIISLGNMGGTGGIDWILTSKGDFKVYEVFNDSAQTGSDHHPRICRYDFK